jgi:hypothetical protein
MPDKPTLLYEPVTPGNSMSLEATKDVVDGKVIEYKDSTMILPANVREPVENHEDRQDD